MVRSLAVVPLIAASALAAPSGKDFTFKPSKTTHSPTHVDVSDPASQSVTNSEAFSTGAGNNDNSNIYDGNGDGSDSYTCYYGSWQDYPANSDWMQFDDMFNNNKPAMAQGCANLGLSPNDTDEQIGQIYNAIQQVAQTSLVDHRFILAVIMQESIGCVHVGETNNGVNNPGIMQSDNGSSFVGNSASTQAQQDSITQMVIDGTQGTASGDGLVQGINMYGNIYEAARYYNSGTVDPSDLNNAEGATASYVNDIANRMTGWVFAQQGSC